MISAPDNNAMPAKPRDSEGESIELRPDADTRFRAAVHAAATSGPKHRSPKEAKR